MASILNARQARFVAEYLIDLNATAAAERAGYSAKTARVQGPRLLQNVAVAAAVAEGCKARLEAAAMSAEEVVAELSRIGRSNIRNLFDESGSFKALKDIPDDALRAVAAVKFSMTSEGELLREVKQWDKLRALDKLGAYHRLWTDGAQVSGDLVINFTNVEAPGGKKG